jgi:hypothetical protein
VDLEAHGSDRQKNIVDAAVYLANTDQVTGEVLHVDGGVHVGRWQPAADSRVVELWWEKEIVQIRESKW